MESQLRLIQKHKHVEVSENQRCFFIGDIHGHWKILQKTLSQVSFCPRKDILISVGDIVDHHDDSLKVAYWLLSQPNIHVVCGNHEKYFLDYLQHPETGFYYTSQRIGGRWTHRHTKNELLKLGKLMQDKLTMSLTVRQNNKKIGVIHAAAPDDWHIIENKLLPTDEWLDYIDNRAQYRQARNRGVSPVNNVDAVIQGHVGASFLVSGNQYWIDTFHTEGELMLLEISDIHQCKNEELSNAPLVSKDQIEAPAYLFNRP